MLVFNAIEYRNFLATGSAGNKIQFDLTNTTLITGQNGSGKSTGVTDALCFVLFNRPFRNINRGQLVNSINGKGCLVTIQFTVNGNEYKVSRGIKPNVFEIWENGILFNKDAASRDYQKILEEQILKYNYKVFTQIVILGSASFVPFMELPKAARREVIEDVLDISVFSRMNDILKKEYALTKEALLDFETELKILRNNVDNQKKIIKLISESTETVVNDYQIKIDELSKKNDIIDLDIKNKTIQLEELYPQIDGYQDFVEKKNKANKMLIKLQTEISSISKELEFFSNHENCPVCAQNIEHDHKDRLSIGFSDKQKKCVDDSKTLEEAIEKLTAKINKLDLIKDDINKGKNNISILNHELEFNNSEIKKIHSTIESKRTNNDIEPEKKKLQLIIAEGLGISEQKAKETVLCKMQEEALLLLKDNGIKTSIIDEYLPVINKLINQYLADMDFFCNFNIDNEFNEVIKSRYRDDFSYESFSQGEKQRIDLALMITFRQIAKMKNSLNCNLLVLDEIFSSSLDASAVSFLIDMLNNMKDSNIFIVTHHSDEFIDVFDRHIQFHKVNNFSIMKVEA